MATDPKASASSVNSVLKRLLASEYVLSVKTQVAHWNVVDCGFAAVHEFFGSQYGTLNALIDEVAERIRQLEGTAPVSMKEFIELALVKEFNVSGTFPAETYYKALLADHEKIISELQSTIVKLDAKDPVTANIMQDWTAKHQKMAWFLRSHLVVR